MNKVNNYVGLDVHKATIQVALFAGNGGRPLEWSLVNEDKAIASMVCKLRRHCRSRCRGTDIAVEDPAFGDPSQRTGRGP